jgi:hypothetical protein
LGHDLECLLNWTSGSIDSAIGNRYDTAANPGRSNPAPSRAAAPPAVALLLGIGIGRPPLLDEDAISTEYSLGLNAFIPFLHS